MEESSGRGRGYLLPLAIKTVSLIAIYATYGVLQERIIKGHYSSNVKSTVPDSEPLNDTFTSAPFLVLCNRLVSFATGIVLAQIEWAKGNYSQLPTNASTSRRPHTVCGIISELLSRVRPSSPFISYAIVAGLNNAATLSQYTSLSHLSFTTSTLGKSAKMVPVLILGHMWYGKRYKSRQWIGAAIVILGIWSYLISLLSIDQNKKKAEIAEKSNLIGVGCLLAYLFFDGLTGTMQERVFGQAKRKEKISSLMGITPGIIDQMVCIALFERQPHAYSKSDMGQLILFHHRILCALFRTIRPNSLIHQTRSIIINTPTSHLHAKRHRNRRPAHPFSRDSNLWGAHRQSYHDSPTIRQHRMQRSMVRQYGCHPTFWMGGDRRHGCWNLD